MINAYRWCHPRTAGYKGSGDKTAALFTVNTLTQSLPRVDPARGSLRSGPLPPPPLGTINELGASPEVCAHAKRAIEKVSHFLKSLVSSLPYTPSSETAPLRPLPLINYLYRTPPSPNSWIGHSLQSGGQAPIMELTALLLLHLCTLINMSISLIRHCSLYLVTGIL